MTDHETGHKTGPRKGHIGKRGSIAVTEKGGMVGQAMGTRTDDSATTKDKRKTGQKPAVT